MSLQLEQAFAAHRRLLWGLCYRMTSVAADADDLVQETFVRALQSPPDDLERDLRPWLVRVATRLSLDALRRRRATPYTGTWLPEVVPTERVDGPIAVEPTVDGVHTTAGRYELLESVSLGFLLALEALTPSQRAVLLLRDVFDYSVRETAHAIDVSEANVKTTLHRARTAMAAYDKNSRPSRPNLREDTREALARLIMAIGSRDPERLSEVLDEEIISYSDGGGEFFAARKPLVGRAKVLHFYTTLWRRRGDEHAEIEIRDLNGRPALIVRLLHPHPGDAARYAVLCEINQQGNIVRTYVVMASAKLSFLNASLVL